MNNNTKKTCKAIIFSDIHYAFERPINNGSIIDRKLTQYAIPLVNKLIDKINAIKPDIVINLGDLIEDSGDHNKDIVDLKFIWNVLQNIQSPFYSCIGNHDLRYMSSRSEVEQIMGYDNATFSVDLNGYHFVFLALDVNNKASTQDGGILKTRFIPEKDIKWLKEDLAKNSLPCLVFNHYGLAEDEMLGNWWFEKSPSHALLSNRQEIKDILENDKNILAVFSGHQHWTKTLVESGIDYHVVGSLTEDINSDGVPDGIYFEVDLNDENIQITKHHLRLDAL